MKRLICRLRGHDWIVGPYSWAPAHTVDIKYCRRCLEWHPETWERWERWEIH
jgi:hypothetical protein